MSWGLCLEWKQYFQIFGLTWIGMHLSLVLVYPYLCYREYKKGTFDVCVSLADKVFAGVIAYSLLGIMHNMFICLEVHWFAIEAVFDLYTALLFVVMSLMAEYWTFGFGIAQVIRHTITPVFVILIFASSVLMFVFGEEEDIMIFLVIQYLAWGVCALTTTFILGMNGYKIMGGDERLKMLWNTFMFLSLFYIGACFVMLVCGKYVIPRLFSYIVFNAAAPIGAFTFYLAA